MSLQPQYGFHRFNMFVVCCDDDDTKALTQSQVVICKDMEEDGQFWHDQEEDKVGDKVG